MDQATNMEQRRTHNKKARLEDNDDLQVTTMSQERQRRQEVLQEIKNGSISFGVLPEELRDDEEIALAAVQRAWSNARHVSDRLKSNKSFVLAAVKVDIAFLMHASEELRADRDVVLVAVHHHWLNLEHASQELQGNREIVLVAARQDYNALRYTTEELRGDRRIAVAALGSVKTRQGVEYVVHRLLSRDIQNDPVVAAAMLRKGGRLRPGSEITMRLKNVLVAVRALPETFTLCVADETSLDEFSRRWEHSIWLKIWMTLQLEPPGMPGTGRLFVVLSGLPLDLQQVKELRHCFPVIVAALSFPNQDWRYLKSYSVNEDGSYH